MDNRNVLFITHQASRCGVYDFGERVYSSLINSKKYNFIRLVCRSKKDLLKAIKNYSPVAIIYNYTIATQPWIVSKICRGFYFNHIADIKVPQIGIIHEITQTAADTAVKKRTICFTKVNKIDNSIFDSYIAADPTLLLKNPLVFKTGRVVPKYNSDMPAPDHLIITSFGFGTAKKGFDKLVLKVQKEFDNAEIRINVPFSEFCDNNGEKARKYADDCKKLIYKLGVRLNFTHHFFDQDQLLNFLAQSSLIAFLYEDKIGRGVSSVIDYALAANRPIAISDSIMFRHISEANPSICINDSSLKEIINNGVAPLNRFINEWTPENLLWEYERAVGSTIAMSDYSMNPKLTSAVKGFVKSFLLRVRGGYTKPHNWLRTTKRLYEDDYKKINNDVKYQECFLTEKSSLNVILNDAARAKYEPAVKALFELVPNTMAKKIPRANVNQGFVFDTVYHFIKKYDKPRILCVGSYEDTACMALIKLGFQIEEIDPMVNYTLQEFITKPNVLKGSYDIIFSTSVIEHDSDDKSFMECVDKLLASNGVFIMSCDYKDGWKTGDLKPPVCARLYTKEDLISRLPSYLNNCEFIDTPDWSFSEPDFILDKYRYAFASFVIRKKA